MAIKILLTNDDGINSEGLSILVNKVKSIKTNDFIEILVVAPKTEQSAKSHSLMLRKEFEVKEVNIFNDVKTYYIDSTPADCVRYAYYGLKYDFDLCLSGINIGYNVGFDIMYSGTVAAAFEAISLGKKAIALSCHASSFEGFNNWSEKTLEFIVNNHLLDKWSLYNINFPINPKGIRITKQGYSNFITYYHESNGFAIQLGDNITDSSIDNIHLDTSCVMNEYISISPLTHERTKEEIYSEIKDLKS